MAWRWPLYVLIGLFMMALGRACMSQRGRFEVVHKNPIQQDLTRASFLHKTDKGNSIHFSTLEANNARFVPNRFLWSSFDTLTERTTSQEIQGSIEARSYAYSTTLKNYVLGASLGPQILLFDPEKNLISGVYRGPRSGPWIHGIAVNGERAYTILSGAGKPSDLNGILAVNLRTGNHRFSRFETPSEQAYGGVQTIDPTGRVWFYRAYPMQLMWFDAVGGMRTRSIQQPKDWIIESWDSFRGVTYLIFSDGEGRIIKKPADLSRLELFDIKESIPEVPQFLRLIPVDLYHNAGPALRDLYFDPDTSSFFMRTEGPERLSFLGSVLLGKPRVMGFSRFPQESPVAWLHPTLGEIEVLGLDHDALVIWLRGRKSYGRASLRDGSIHLREIAIKNLSAADITSLVAGEDGILYGGGYLTMSDLFRFNPVNQESQVLKSAIPHGEGQINTMFNGLDGMIYGAGYPDSVLFRFDPSAPWNPGSTLGSNPLNLGPMGHHRQSRAYRGIQALDGTVWIPSVSEYAATVANALARADFSHGSLIVKTDLDDGMPQVEDLAVFDRSQLLLLGSGKEGPALFLLDQEAFRVMGSRRLRWKGGTLTNLDPMDHTRRRLFLSQGRRLYRVGTTLSLEPVHTSPREILRVLADGPTALFLVGQDYVERLDLASGRSELTRSRWQKPGGRVFRDSSWKPVAVHSGSLFFADGSELWRYTPARGRGADPVSYEAANIDSRQ